MDKNIDILVIDDDKHMRDGCDQILRKSQYKVVLAEDGFQGLEFMKNKVFDLVILDLKMPGIDGMEVLKR